LLVYTRPTRLHLVNVRITQWLSDDTHWIKTRSILSVHCLQQTGTRKL